jgi:hypothetical protein
MHLPAASSTHAWSGRRRIAGLAVALVSIVAACGSAGHRYSQQAVRTCLDRTGAVTSASSPHVLGAVFSPPDSNGEVVYLVTIAFGRTGSEAGRLLKADRLRAHGRVTWSGGDGNMRFLAVGPIVYAYADPTRARRETGPLQATAKNAVTRCLRQARS